MKKPSITELINILDKPALLNWANKIGLHGVSIDEYRKKSIQSGLSLHKQVELYLKDGIIPENNILKKNIIFFDDKEILKIEHDIENAYFIGRLDIAYKFNGKIIIADFKSNQSNIYFNNKLQLIAYSMAFDSDELKIISIPDFKVLDINVKNKKPYEDILKHLSNIYYLKNKL